MPRFKIGQKVVAVRSHSQGYFKKGDEFIIDGFHYCPNCNVESVYLIGVGHVGFMECCLPCTFIDFERVFFDGICFAPLEPIREKIKYSFKVNIPKPEIIEREQLIPLKELINNQ